MSRAIRWASVLALLAACGSEDAHVITPADRVDAGSDLDAGPPSNPVTAPDAAIPAKPDAGTPVEEHSGQATFYDANGTGACGFKASTDFFVVAMNATDYSKDDCGSCIAVTGPKGSVTVRITDRCGGCGEGGLDLSITAFTKIADRSSGRADVTWHAVDCP